MNEEACAASVEGQSLDMRKNLFAFDNMSLVSKYGQKKEFRIDLI